MSAAPGQKTRYLVTFAYILAIIAPITAPIFAIGLVREGDQRNAVGVVVLAVVWTAVFVLVIV